MRVTTTDHDNAGNMHRMTVVRTPQGRVVYLRHQLNDDVVVELRPVYGPAGALLRTDATVTSRGRVWTRTISARDLAMARPALKMQASLSGVDRPRINDFSNPWGECFWARETVYITMLALAAAIATTPISLPELLLVLAAYTAAQQVLSDCLLAHPFG